MTNRKNLYGYCIENGEMTVVPEEKTVVKRIAELYIAGASYQSIADSLNKAGTPFSPEAPLWNKHKVRRVRDSIQTLHLGTEREKHIVWRCVSRLEFGTKYCHNSPTLGEDRLHRAIVAALNEYGAIRQEVKESAMELAGMAQDYGVGGSDLLALRRRLDELTAEQALLLDKVLEDMDNLDLNAQLKILAEEKQSILEQMAALQEKAERQTLQASRRRELEEWLGQQPIMFTEYDDSVTRRLVERITVVDAETIRVKLKDTDVEIKQKLY